MAYQEQDLGHTVRKDPAAARTLIMSAYGKAKGSVPKAAKSLKVSERSLHRWTSDLELGKEVDAIRVKAGLRPSNGYRSERCTVVEKGKRCKNDHAAKGMCKNHYYQAKRAEARRTG